MKTFGLVVACVLVGFVGVVGIAQADVVPGNLITNGDFDTDLSSWTAYSVQGTVPVWTNTVTDGGGVLYAGGTAGNLYQTCNSSIGSSTDPLVLTFDLGSPNGSVPEGGVFQARMFRSGGGSWPTLDATESTTITAAELNTGMQHYTIHFPSTSIVLGDQYELDLETYGVGTEATVTLDNVALVRGTVPEPGTLALLGTAIVGLLAYAWRKRR